MKYSTKLIIFRLSTENQLKLKLKLNKVKLKF